jgi:hypothetical protein
MAPIGDFRASVPKNAYKNGDFILTASGDLYKSRSPSSIPR